MEPSLNCIVVYLITAQNQLHSIVRQQIVLTISLDQGTKPLSNSLPWWIQE